MLNENRDKISGSDVSNLESAIADARKAMEQGGADNIKKATEALTTASHKLAEVMYQNASANAAGGAGAGAGAAGGASTGPADNNGKTDDVIDAEVVDENK
jgi:molecular chaperone DnaK